MKIGKVDFIVDDVDGEGLGCEIKIPGTEIISIVWKKQHTEQEMLEAVKKAFDQCDIYDIFSETIFKKLFLEFLGEQNEKITVNPRND